MSRDFPGTSGNYITTVDSTPLSITGTAITMFGWVRPDVVTGSPVLFSKSPDDSSSGGYAMAISSTATENAWFRIDDASFPGDAATGATDLGTGAWYNFGGRKSGTGANAIRVFLAGVSDGSATSNKSMTDNASDLRFGTFPNTNTQRLDGLLAECAVWNVALTDNEMLSLGKGTPPNRIRPASLAIYAPFWGIGSVEADLSGNRASITITGTVNAGAFHPPINRR